MKRCRTHDHTGNLHATFACPRKAAPHYGVQRTYDSETPADRLKSESNGVRNSSLFQDGHGGDRRSLILSNPTGGGNANQAGEEAADVFQENPCSPTRVEESMRTPAPAKRAPKQAPEGLLLFVLVIAILITLASFLLTRHPASGIMLPLGVETSESSHLSK